MTSLLLLAWTAVALLQAQSTVYPNRWAFVQRGLTSDTDVEDIRQIAAIASQHGYTAILLSARFESIDLQPATGTYFARLAMVKEICDQNGLEIIPVVFNPSNSVDIYHDLNLAEGFPVNDAPYVVSGTRAQLAQDPLVTFMNGSLENYKGNTPAGWNLVDGPGAASFIDTSVFQDGKTSMRFQNFTSVPAGNARLMQEVPVHPNRNYRVSFWVKSDSVVGAFQYGILNTDGNTVTQFASLPSTTDWRQIAWSFNSGVNNKVRIYAGVWGGQSGRFWLDNFLVDEIGLANVLRRDGTPLSVRNETTGMVYREGVDYAPVLDPQIDFKVEHDGPPITLLPGGAIQDRQRLLVSYYHGQLAAGRPYACLSNPKLYDILRAQVQQIDAMLAPAKYLLGVDEIRELGTDWQCKQRGISTAQIFGDSIAQAMAIVRAVNPAAEVYSWSDMLDPNQNAHPNYYLVGGDLTGSASYVPSDLGIVDWNYPQRRASLDYFSRLGFRTVAGAYYDANTLDTSRDWLAALDQTPGAVGIMYTTWNNQYNLLAAFGDMVSLAP